LDTAQKCFMIFVIKILCNDHEHIFYSQMQRSHNRNREVYKIPNVGLKQSLLLKKMKLIFTIHFFILSETHSKMELMRTY
jgi:hypothetical protein